MLSFGMSVEPRFVQDVDVRLQEAQDEVESLQKTSKALMEFLCDDEKSFKLEEACFTFHCFCQRFQKAVRVSTTDDTSINIM